MTTLNDALTGTAGTTLPTHDSNWVFSNSGAISPAHYLDGAGGLRWKAEDGPTCSYDTGSASHYCEAVLGANWNAANDMLQFGVCITAPTSGRSEFYSWTYDGSTYRIRRGSGRTSLNSNGGASPVAGDTMRMEYDNSTGTITLKKNGSNVCTATDSTFSGYTRGGLTSALDTRTVDNDDVYRSLIVGDLGGGAAVSLMIYLTGEV